MRSYLSSVAFPATKAEVIACSEGAGAPDIEIQQLQELPVERFDSAEAVEAAMADGEPQGGHN
jgi:hypothetical protein